jgi:hypothetical protein
VVNGEHESSGEELSPELVLFTTRQLNHRNKEKPS